MKILVCEDDLMMVKAIEHKLLQDNYEVVIASDGKEAVEIIQKQDFDLIMTDMLMPFFNGTDIIDMVRNKLQKPTPILVFSKLGNEDTIIEALQLGANDYLAKPFKPNELAIRVKHLLMKKVVPEVRTNAKAGEHHLIPEWTYEIITSLADPHTRISEVLYKVQGINLHDREHDFQVKEWISKELNGYRWQDVPDFRKVKASIYGNFVEDRGFGLIANKNHVLVPPEYFKDDIREQVMSAKISCPVTELERMAEGNEDYHINLPQLVNAQVAMFLERGWHVDLLWQKISLQSLESLLGAIRSNLIRMLLKPVAGDQPASPQRIDDKVNLGDMLNKFLFEEPVRENPIFRKKEQPVYRTGPAPMPSFNPAAISENPYHSEKTRGDLIRFVGELTRNVETLGLRDDDKKDLELEIKRIESQLARQNIKTRIISDSLNVINSILHEGK